MFECQQTSKSTNHQKIDVVFLKRDHQTGPGYWKSNFLVKLYADKGKARLATS